MFTFYSVFYRRESSCYQYNHIPVQYHTVKEFSLVGWIYCSKRFTHTRCLYFYILRKRIEGYLTLVGILTFNENLLKSLGELQKAKLGSLCQYLHGNQRGNICRSS